jgi:hypothetical protein
MYINKHLFISAMLPWQFIALVITLYLLYVIIINVVFCG